MFNQRRQPRVIQTSSRRLAAVAGALALSSALALGGCSSGDATHEAGPDHATLQQGTTVAVVHPTPSCGCCKNYEAYLRRHGYEVQSVVAEDLDPIRADYGIPRSAESCHTSIIDGYAVEGHVPVEAIDSLLASRPDISGIAVPGMPENSPGMGEPNGQPLEVVAVGSDGQLRPFMTL